MSSSPPTPPLHDVAAAIIRRDDGRVLLVHRSATMSTFPNYWGPVSGYVDESDISPAAAVLREIQEEIGARARIVREADPFEVDLGSGRVRVFPFLCELADPHSTFELDRENQGYAWLTIEEALDRETVPALDEDLRRLGLLADNG